jgi:hypothetical protein
MFTAPGRGDVADARDGLEAAAWRRGWTVRRARDGEEFTRLVLDGPNESVVVDLAVDATPALPPIVTLAGPAFGPDELAGRKMIALFDRAEARDFADVRSLAERYGTDRLLKLAADVDRFDTAIFATMLDSLDRFTDEEIPTPAAHVEALRTFFADWSRQLRQGPSKPA